MCGILGFASNKVINNKINLTKGISTINHRGPDDSGEWWSEDGLVGFAHKRLAILDLSEKGHQPMKYSNDQYIIVFNGEIYNYIELYKALLSKGYEFTSSSDTEVILAAYCEWGEECVEKFNGMFAFAIYDSLKQILFISRDRAGEKPLYYHYDEGVLSFSSELKALLIFNTQPQSVDYQSLDCYLTTGYVPSEDCMLKGYKKLRAGHSLIFDLETTGIKIYKYWELPALTNYSSVIKISDLEEELKNLLENSVSQQLVADVPVGIFLSGGLDSSIITAIASRRKEKLKTFSVSFSGFQNFDEKKHSLLIANHFKTDHYEIEATPPDADLLLNLAKQFDEPIIDSSMIPTYYVSKLAQKHCKVILGGDGADELFGGYEHYSRFELAQKFYGLIPKPVREAVSYLSQKTIPVGMHGKNWLEGLDIDFISESPLVTSYFNPTDRKKLLHGVCKDWNTNAEKMLHFSTPTSKNTIDRSTRRDFYNYLQHDILLKLDMASMLTSLEVRSPFLDKDLIEFAFEKVPPYLKATSKHKKILLKSVASKILPSNFEYDRKQGFSIPINFWLQKNDFKDIFYDVLLSNQATFDKKYVNGLFKGLNSNRKNGERLFGLLMFELWKINNKVSV